MLHTLFPRKLSVDSVGSDISFIKDSEVSNTGVIANLLDQRHKLNRVLMTMQRRLPTAKKDMEDLIARLNQEVAIKEYLTTNAKELEIELETTKQKKSTKTSDVREKEYLAQELDFTKLYLVNLLNFHQELLMKSKADSKVLVKEVKSLRNYQTELKQDLGRSFKENSELERFFQKEKHRTEHAKIARGKLLHEYGILTHQLQECSVNFLVDERDKFNVDSSLSDALDLLTTSENRIGLLLADVQFQAQVGEINFGNDINGDDLGTTDNDIRKMLTYLFIDNVRLRK
ncbi:hypothetical protein GIB67_011570 [Kingdonia uniflora]|uniref:Uncharacterized protein n=1 Tax=Kingdonia uniflora TaxID=39325 RepID=A0A7J7NLW9_9MAGN|nr:hypothetical protein GIB67_011570 [Kingdonia uniflora]